VESPSARHASSPSELQASLAAQRAGVAHIVYRDGSGAQRIAHLPEGSGEPISIGRSSTCAICIDWDGEVSRVHAELTPAGNEWAVEDNGLSRNGTFVNGTRVAGRQRLADGDQLRVGLTRLAYRAATPTAAVGTIESGALPSRSDITPGQMRVLVSLCRPYAEKESYGIPASNREIADDLHLSLAAVKSQIRALFDRFGVEELPQNQKRARLVELAFLSGAVSQRELRAVTARGRPEA
jgi:hypothetical protein